MKVDPQQLIDDGYIVLRQVVPPDQLEALRTNFEILVEKQKIVWERDGNRTKKPEVSGQQVHNRECFSMRSLTQQLPILSNFACTRTPWCEPATHEGTRRGNHADGTDV